MSGIKKLSHWVRDYLYAIHGHSLVFIHKDPPKHYLEHIINGKNPIILIPGVFEKWHFLKAIADPLSLRGHPVYVLEHLDYNTKEIHHTAESIREFIDKEKLREVIIIAHSKGGLIGKHLLNFHNKDEKIKKVIAIASPFGGSYITRFIPNKAIKELSPYSKIIKELTGKKEFNHKIISIFGVFDNHVWPESSCRLEGAKNIEVHTHGHHRILFDKKVRDIIVSDLENI